MKIVVIGGGPGGYVAAISAAQLGAEVILIEKDNPGGTCLNSGCIPTKSLLHSAELLHFTRNSADYGIKTAPVLDFDQVQKRKGMIVGRLLSGLKALIKQNKIDSIHGNAFFTGPDTLELNGDQGKRSIRADQFIIASGSLPAKPPILGIEGAFCIDSTDALNFSKLPSSLIIIGGGVIGVEFSCIYAEFGVHVEIIEMADQILPNMDRELADTLRKILENRGINITTGAHVKKIQEGAGAWGQIYYEIHGTEKKLEAEKILVATGRIPNTKGLRLEMAGVRQEREAIVVDSCMRTNLPHIYAIGDCTGGLMLAHVASAQGEVAAKNAVGKKAIYSPAAIPACVYTTPEFAGIGSTEEELVKCRIQYQVSRFPLSANGRALILGSDMGMVKVLVGKEFGNILGIHILGSCASELIAQAGLTMNAELCVEDIINTIFPHPSISESIREAILGFEMGAIHLPPKSNIDI